MEIQELHVHPEYLARKAELKAWAETLTEEQLYAAYTRAQDMSNKADVEMAIGWNRTAYARDYGIDTNPVTEDELAAMADVFYALWTSADVPYRTALETAISDVLGKRKTK